MKRQRSYNKEFDYWGIAAIGDYQYDDGFDKWEEISDAFKKSDEIILRRSHGDVRDVGIIKHWDLDKGNKKVYIGFNRDDIAKDIKFDEINQVSIEYETLGEKIVGVNHIAIGNTFKQKCPLKVCNITKQRGDEPDTTTDVVDEPDEIEEPEVPEETTESETEEKSELEVIKEQNELLKKQIEEMSKTTVESEPEPPAEGDEEIEKQDKKPKLGFKDKLKHDLPSKKEEPEEGITPWKYT